jgi:hypothetical protein
MEVPLTSLIVTKPERQWSAMRGAEVKQQTSRVANTGVAEEGIQIPFRHRLIADVFAHLY